MTIQLKTRNSKLKVASPVSSIGSKFKGVATLRHRLLISLLPAVLIPFVLASTIGYIITERRAKSQIIEHLEDNAVTASSTISTFIRNSFQTLELIAANPEVIQAMKAGNNLAQQQNLVQKPIAELEEEFAAAKLLTPNQSLNDYLQQIVQSGQISEILITQGNGFNIAYSNPTSDFVQREKSWWLLAQKAGTIIDEPNFDESANITVIPVSQGVRDPQSDTFLGVIEAEIPISSLQLDLSSIFSEEDNQNSRLLIVDPDESFVLFDSRGEEMGAAVGEREEEEEEDEDEMNPDQFNMIGGKSILEAVETRVIVEGNSLSFEAKAVAASSDISFLSLEEARRQLAKIPGIHSLSIHQEEIFSETSTIASFRYQDRIYTLSTVPRTDFVSIDVLDYGVVTSAARNLLIVFALTAIGLGGFSLGLILLIAREVSEPIINLSTTTQAAAAGNLYVEAELEGTLETRTLADNFNYLVTQTKASLQQQKDLAETQRQEKEELEAAIYNLIEEISSATDGDLTVRATLNNLELSTVADLFNAIIDSLQDIAIEAKESSNQVGSSLQQNETEIRSLNKQAIAEAEETRNTLKSIAQMSRSIQLVAANASQAEKIADDTYNTVLTSTKDIDSTVNSILNLRTTIGETAKKMKRLGESSQKISQAVSFIEEIALKTNILAINASVEAGRAGEYGQGFSIVAEQVGALAEQSSVATREIARIVSDIQSETQEVNQAMESGTAQVVETTGLVSTTKEGLNLVLKKSQEINRLMGSISQTTISQADTSQDVTKLMEKIANLSEMTSQSSAKVAQSIVETAQIAAKLESTVSQFKVAK